MSDGDYYDEVEDDLGDREAHSSSDEGGNDDIISSDSSDICKDSARCTDPDCERCFYRYSSDPHSDWALLKRKSGHKARDLWSAIVKCRNRITWLEYYESAKTVDMIGRMMIVLNAIQLLICRFPRELKNFSIEYTMAFIIKIVLPKLPEDLPKKPLRTMHKLVRDTLDMVRYAVEQRALELSLSVIKHHQHHSAQSTRSSGPASLLYSDREVSLSGRSFNTKTKSCLPVDMAERETMCVSKGMEAMSLNATDNGSHSDDDSKENDNDPKKNINTKTPEELTGPYGPLKLMVPKAWGCNEPFTIDDF
jgi:hypothetical protein